MEVNDRALYRLIGTRIKELRKQQHITQGELAEAAGLLRTSMVNIEAGRQKAPVHVLYAMFARLGAEPREVFPVLAELDTSEVVPVVIAGKTTEVPPRAAEMLSRILSERS